MTSFAIGSVNGDYQALMRLLTQLAFNPETDRLWFTGNLVNTGSESLEVLRFVKGLGKTAVTVLGNQELHVLGVAAGVKPPEASDNLQAILDAPDREELLKWLRQRSLVHHDSTLNYTMVHAGIPAEWVFSQTLTFAYEVESALSGSNYLAFFENFKQDQSRWHAKLRGWKRLNFIANALTCMTYCTGQGKLIFSANDDVDDQLMPWYRVPERQTCTLRIVFADDIGFKDATYAGIYPLVGGKVLSAVKLLPEPEFVSEVRSD